MRPPACPGTLDNVKGTQAQQPFAVVSPELNFARMKLLNKSRLRAAAPSATNMNRPVKRNRQQENDRPLQEEEPTKHRGTEQMDTEDAVFIHR